jgi:replicative DNA helicase
MREAVRALIDEGAEFLWLDYLQKFRGLTGDRRNEVGATLTYFQEECQEGGVPGIALSQFRRRDMHRPPMLSDMKESGDIENECRLAVLAWRDSEDTALVNCRIAKSAYGAGGLRFQYRRTNIGTLEEVTHDNIEF